MTSKIHVLLKSFKNVLGFLFCPPLNKIMFSICKLNFYDKLMVFFFPTSFLPTIAHHTSSWLYFAFFSSKEFHFISLKKYEWSIWVKCNLWLVKKKGSLDYTTQVMKMGLKFITKIWWKCILGIISNLIFKLLPMGNIICMGLSMNILCY
jgi:hypothetical protein